MKREILLILVAVMLLQSCNAQPQKINGVSFVASREAISQVNVMPVVKVNANFAAIMPFGFIRDIAHPEIKFNTQRQWLGETRNGSKQYALELRKQDIKIMLKPQIWVSHGIYTGHIEMANEENWQVFEQSYSKFILEYAKLAEELHAEIFCIGTELEKFIAQRPEYWVGLIAKIKDIYKGKLTYAANWDEFKRTPFWDELDYIGIDAYFPVSETKTPTLEECMSNWKVHKAVIKSTSEVFKKPILFTEFGYRSVDYSGKEPWRSDRGMNSVNLQAQTNTSQALFKTFWKEEWFAGGFIWKWFHNHETAGGVNNSRFTPQNKPVEKLIQSYYGDHK
ncbi:MULTISPECIES: glycoside hydrolase [unclassified Algibacter]|uniref:glycoside hydrolase family 113 n=1 Tax=unclassified Algibacter TaxID=2615009 RepID=UPI00131DB71A|nr:MULTISPECIES: glycoside hydrolase [unclassified Algibacter]MCL5128985.1 glycoside hydrolase [Algibacter sp. L4_22]